MAFLPLLKNRVLLARAPGRVVLFQNQFEDPLKGKSSLEWATRIGVKGDSKPRSEKAAGVLHFKG